MIIVACLEAAALVAVVHLLLRHHTQSETAWTAERRELVSRIQAPDRIPIRETAEMVIPEREEDEWATVGRVDIDPDYGLNDDG